MAISDIYTVDSGLQNVTAASQTGILAGSCPSTKRIWIVGARMFVGTTLAAAGQSVVFTLARTSNNPVGQASATIGKNDPAAPASLIGTTLPTLGTGWLTAPTLSGAIIAEWELPQTTGSMWEEFPPLGYEFGLAASTGFAMFVNHTNATSTPYSCQLIWSE